MPFTAQINKLPATTPFVGPETLERQRGKAFKVRLGANESGFGMSPLAQRAMIDALTESRYYADPESYALRRALAEKHGVEAEEICVDAGIDTLLGLTVRMLVEPGQTVVNSHGGYPTFNYHVAGYGAELVTVPYAELREDPRALIDAAIEHRAALVYLANPDNPMGTVNGVDAISAMMAQVPEHCVMLLDEAYIDFSGEHIAPPMDPQHPRLLRFRTFSKAWGMAGQRIGYAIGHRDLIAGYEKIRNHFGMNRLAQIAALKSLEDPAFLSEVRQRTAAGRERVYALARANGLQAVPSHTNFVALDLGDAERAARMIKALAERDVFMRMPGTAPLNRHIRVGIGSESEMDYLVEVFADALAAADRDQAG